ncbi:MAG TPA: hypothetical protein VNL98_03860 [Gemmatimonadales bacterium]|nr:hypothetical protein [Gemmatimonadales bacterium]
MALLHSFWYEEAGRAFRAAAEADTSCAMAQWGLASSYLHPLWAPPTPAELREATAAVARARALGARSHREGMWVDAIAAYFDSAASAPHPRRLRQWSEAMERLYRAHPEDGEAAAIYALSLVAVANASPPDTTYALLRQAADILEPLFRRSPEHPGLAHYLIHATDAPALAARGSGAADRYATIAPSVPHARHMPSHIYIRLGQWDRAIASNASSAAAARQYEREQRMTATWDQTLHAMDYLAYAYLQKGQDTRARSVADTIRAVNSWTPERSLAAEYALAAVPARYALEREQWPEAAGLVVREGLQPPATAATRFARTIGSARGTDARAARAELAALAALDEEVARRQMGLWVNMVRAQRMAAEAWVLLAEGDTAGATRLAREAADLEDTSEKHPVTPGAILPARELLGDMLLLTGRAGDALAAYEASLRQQPNRARSLAGAARAAEAAGDRAAARRYREELRRLLANADQQRRVTLLSTR